MSILNTYCWGKAREIWAIFKNRPNISLRKMIKYFIKDESIIFQAQMNHQVGKSKLKGGLFKCNLNISSFNSASLHFENY